MAKSEKKKQSKQETIDELIEKAHLGRTYQGAHAALTGRVKGRQIEFMNEFFRAKISYSEGVKLLKKLSKEHLGQSYNEFWYEAPLIETRQSKARGSS
jgi:hypothetical protein